MPANMYGITSGTNIVAPLMLGSVNPSGGAPAPLVVFNTSGTPLWISSNGIISTNNSTTTVLASNGSFIGTYEEVKDYSSIGVLIKTDSDTANNGAKMDFSSDGTNTGRSINATLTSGTNGYFFSLIPEARYFRVNYTNSATAQSSFLVHTVLSQTADGLTQVPFGTNFTDGNDGAVTIAIGKGRDSTGSYFTTRSDPSGNQGVYVKSINTALADTLSNTQFLGVSEAGSTAVQTVFPFIFNGTTWDRLRGDSTSGLYVNVRTGSVGIQPLKAWKNQQFTVASGTQTDIGSPGLANRKTISIKGLKSNTSGCYIGSGTGVASNNGYEINAQESVELELDAGVSVFLMTDSVGNQKVCVAEVA